MSGQEKEWTVGERFGANLVWFRSQAGLSQQALADRVGMKRVTIGELERGRVPRLDTILKLAAGLDISPGALIAWIRWDPASHEHFETPPAIADISGYEVWDFDLPGRFRVSSIGYETRDEFKARLKRRGEENDPVLQLLRDDAPKVAPRPRPDAAWVLRTGQALKSLREERGLTQQQLAKRARTTDAFIAEIEEGKIFDPGLRILTEICRALDGEGSELSAQIEPVRAERKAAVQKVLDELAERDARQAEEGRQ
jgi:transcriptional regulator with XRE-family HTH domain